jgi:hypothetical protein
MNTRQPFLIALALLLGLSSFGHVFAAAFCPRMQGRGCCLAKTVRYTHKSSCTHEDMAMDDMPMDHLTMHGRQDISTMDGMVMGEMVTEDISIPPSSSNNFTVTLDDALEQPVEPCPHCMSHSGFPNAPVSSVNAPDESRKTIDSAPLPTSSFLWPSVITVASNGLPREHAPPGTSAPQHILNSVFLI